MLSVFHSNRSGSKEDHWEEVTPAKRHSPAL